MPDARIVPDGRAQQIAAGLRAAITAGRLAPGTRLPSVRQLQVQHHVARETASRALGLLVADGLAMARPGSGTYVRPRAERLPLSPDRYSRVSRQEAASPGPPAPNDRPPRAAGFRGARTAPAETHLAAVFALPVGAPVYERTALLTHQGAPACLLITHYRPEHLAGTALAAALENNGEREHAFEVLAAHGLAPAAVTEQLLTRSPTDAERTLLQLAGAEPVMEVCRIARGHNGHALEHARLVYAGHRFLWSYSHRL
ncbi:GntR family transcriptional regulator [Planobispora rosea]|nr:GntR family transcriptional regulator [Planobispora rosea]